MSAMIRSSSAHAAVVLSAMNTRCTRGCCSAVITCLVVVLTLTGCGGDSGPDSGALLACSHFSNVADDAAAGVLTDDELRDKIKEVEDDASVSEEPGVAESARRMLAAVTAVDNDAYASAQADFIAACNAAAD